MLGQVERSFWTGLRKGLVLGGESLWNSIRDFLARAVRNEVICRRGRANAEESAGAIELRIEQETDGRAAIRLPVRVGGERMTTVAADHDHHDDSGVHRVLKRFEDKAK